MFDIVATRVFKYFRFNIFELNNNRLYARQERPLTSPFDSFVRSQTKKANDAVVESHIVSA